MNMQYKYIRAASQLTILNQLRLIFVKASGNCQSLESHDDATCIDDTEAADDGTLVATFSTVLQSLSNLYAYLETVGCDSYENFYSLVDHV